ncbi:MAG: UDP-N-acetylglucosamine 2-epimerase [Prevotella sp.]|nr:UDP-N-acetylglucosamine 2-epimerase [Bacteroides sp.]MCM1366303.1 UDP-N-acetylglucosamine 2-epimerase [Prevotella sp.]MCM1437107.1 UDP-N-acetylglucosamine 2-epimerase [Prevotella sp.]
MTEKKNLRKVCVFTGSRAEYGILSRLMKNIEEHPELELQTVVTNMHLSPEYGLTVSEIESDGFKIDKRVEMLLSSDTAVGTTKSAGLGMIGYADALSELSPDIIVILGDRYEMMGVAQTALFFNIPVAHLHGGEITEGAYDDSIRHAITKLSNLHFTSTEEYRRNVIQMGENPEMVFNFGAPGVDNIKGTEILDKERLMESIGFDLGERYLVATYHPVTKQPGEGKAQTEVFVDSLRKYLKDLKVLITLPNSDTEGREVTQVLKVFEKCYPERVKTVTSLGRKRYYSAVYHSLGVVGNSSSGLIEVPTLGVPTLNIGDRQKGRTRGESVVDCTVDRKEIVAGIAEILSDDMQSKRNEFTNPYEGEDTIRRITEQLAKVDLKAAMEKRFYKI